MPVTFIRKTPVDLSAANQQKDPYMAALEARYAQQVADAQTGVNEALLDAPDFGGSSKFGPAAYGNLRVGGSDPIYGSVQQSIAKMQRQAMMAKAAREYNQRLAANDPRRKDIIGNPAMGA